MFNIIICHIVFTISHYIYIYIPIYNNKNLYFNGILYVADTVLQYRVLCDTAN